MAVQEDVTHMMPEITARILVAECCGLDIELISNTEGHRLVDNPQTVTCPEWLERNKKLLQLYMDGLLGKIQDGSATDEETTKFLSLGGTIEPKRPDWDEYFLGIAEAIAKRADCTRSKVGAVVVDSGRRIMGTGYNGSYSGGPSCLAGECPRGQKSKEEIAPGTSYDTGAGACIAVHAEQNAILYSSYDQRMGGTIYITRSPCDGCLRMLKSSGLHRAVFWSESGHLDVIELVQFGYINRNR